MCRGGQVWVVGSCRVQEGPSVPTELLDIRRTSFVRVHIGAATSSSSRHARWYRCSRSFSLALATATCASCDGSESFQAVACLLPIHLSIIFGLTLRGSLPCTAFRLAQV